MILKVPQVFKNTRTVALILCIGLSQTACYNSYFISKDELKKLGSSMKQEETVTVYADCSSPSATDDAPNTDAKDKDGADKKVAMLADATDATKASQSPDTAVATDASPAATPTSTDMDVPPGCKAINVSTQNSIKILGKNGDNYRVTPFNFTMSGKQIISPEYNMIENLSNVKGADVSQFSTWKTVSLVAGVAAAALGGAIATYFIAPVVQVTK